MDLVITVYSITNSFPESERYNLTSQIRRSAVSIPSNIAEGFGRRGNKELTHFLYISLGSLAELETQLEIVRRLSYVIETETLNQQIKFIRILLTKLIRSIQTQNSPNSNLTS